MRIGLFTDVYHPSMNGISFVIDITRKNLEALGHEVWLIAPEPSVRKAIRRRERHTIRFAAIQGLLFDEQSTSFFFPPRQVRKIAKLDLDVVIIYSPGQIGCLGMHAALKLGTPIIIQYGTDCVAYVTQYRTALLGMIGLSLTMPLSFRLSPRESLRMITWFFNRGTPELTRTQKTLQKMLTAMHERSDAVISVSPKTTKLLEGWTPKQQIVTLPTAVDPLPVSRSFQRRFMIRHKLKSTDEILLYSGRLAPEKNLDMLLEAFDLVATKRPAAKLLLVGNFSYREHLEAVAQKSPHKSRIIFTGPVDHQKIGSIYDLADIFVFPSLTDTQALVLNEAAHAGLPLVWCDHDLNDVLADNKTGFRAQNNARSFAEKVLKLLDNSDQSQAFGKQAQKIAARSTEKQHAKKMEGILEEVIANHKPRKSANL